MDALAFGFSLKLVPSDLLASGGVDGAGWLLRGIRVVANGGCGAPKSVLWMKADGRPVGFLQQGHLPLGVVLVDGSMVEGGGGEWIL